MTDPDKSPLIPEEEDYKRLTRAASWLGSGYGVRTFVLLVPVTLSGLFGLWDPPYRIVGIVVGVVLLISAAFLFYDIPLRRFGRISRVVVWTWIVLSWMAVAYILVARFLF